MRTALWLVTAGLMLALTGCGGDDPAEGLVGNVDKARTAASIAGLQTSLVTAASVQADSPSATADNLVVALQAKDPSSRYTTAPPGAAGVVQVAGGGGGPVMLVTINSGPSSQQPSYVATWQGGGSTMYYIGGQPPAYSPTAPSAPGWSASLPQ